MTPFQSDSQFDRLSFKVPEISHRYGENVHILSDFYLLSLLSRLCSEDTHQPTINELISSLYTNLLHYVVNAEFPRVQQKIATRMAKFHPEAAHYQGPVIDPETSVVSVNLARAGTLPSHICYNALNYFMNPTKVRQDHISIARKTDSSEKVTGSEVSGHKIGGSVDHAIILFPDPMGATGSTIAQALDLYRSPGSGLASKSISLHCIVTPEFIKKLSTTHPEHVIYAVRLDRGLSSPKVLKEMPGAFWNEERGLNDKQYIVPGGGGFGEILNNAYV